MTDDNRTIRSSGEDGDLVIPERLENTYDLIELLNERPCTWTLLVQRKTDRKQCVAKLFSGSAKEYGKHESDILSGLDHPNIPKYIEYFEDGETGVLIREYAAGLPLDKYASRRVMSEPAIIGIGMKICRVLEYLHGLPEPVIHRDIKPQNIIVDDNGDVSLIDFGISRVRNGHNTADTVFAGTVAYAPPEQYGFRQTDRRADIYSLGMVLQYLLTGSVDTTSDKSGTEGSRLGGIIEKCTSFAPEKRFRNIHDLRKSLIRLGRRPAPPALIAGLLAACFIAGGVLGSLAGIVFEKRRAVQTTAYAAEEDAYESMPVTPLSAMLGLNDMSEEELLGITGVFIYGDTVFDSLYTKNAADPSGDRTEVNSYISGHPDNIFFISGPIEIADGTIDDISCLKYLKNLKQLVIVRNNIWDLSPLEGLTQLEFLDLSHNPITDISPLSSLASLRQLYLSACSFSDLSPVYSLSSLEVLCVPGNNITGIDGTSSLTKLREIDVGSNGLVDVSSLGMLPELEKIFIGNNRISDLSFLRSHDRNRIVTLEISRNPIADTSPLGSGSLFDNSRSIYFSAEYLGAVDLSFLRDIDVFNELRLAGTDCSRLSQYVGGKQIDWLIADESGLSDINWLETVKGTWRLDISGNPGITDLSVLVTMSSLQAVTVSEDMRPLTEALDDIAGFSFRFA